MLVIREWKDVVIGFNIGIIGFINLGLFGKIGICGYFVNFFFFEKLVFVFYICCWERGILFGVFFF